MQRHAYFLSPCAELGCHKLVKSFEHFFDRLLGAFLAAGGIETVGIRVQIALKRVMHAVRLVLYAVHKIKWIFGLIGFVDRLFEFRRLADAVFLKPCGYLVYRPAFGDDHLDLVAVSALLYERFGYVLIAVLLAEIIYSVLEFAVVAVFLGKHPEKQGAFYNA